MVQKDIGWQWLLEGFKFELETEVRPKTVEYYYGRARYFARWAQEHGVDEPGLITKRDVQAYFHHVIHDNDSVVNSHSRRRIRRGPNPQWHHYRCLKRFFNWAAGECYIHQNPLDGIKIRPPTLPPIEPWRPEHIDRFFELLKEDWQAAKTPRQKMLAARDHAILSLFLESGLRLEELAIREVQDVDLNAHLLLVKNSKMGKGRWTGFGPQAKKSLWRYLGLRATFATTNALWITEEGRPLSKHGVQEVFRHLKRDAGLEHISGSVHKLRHTWATTHLRHTHDLKGTKILLGHSTYAMVDRYTSFLDAQDALDEYQNSGPLDWMKSRPSRQSSGR